MHQGGNERFFFPSYSLGKIRYFTSFKIIKFVIQGHIGQHQNTDPDSGGIPLSVAVRVSVYVFGFTS